MSNPKIKAHVRLENGRLICNANASRLVVRGKTDISRSVLGHGFTPEYRELWVVMHERDGYIWREVTHAMGINGYHPTLRALVKSVACAGYEIEVLPEPVSEEVLAAIRQRVLQREGIVAKAQTQNRRRVS